MTLTFAPVFAEAGRLWRAERNLLMPLASVFFFLPLLATVLLLASNPLPTSTDPAATYAAVQALAERYVFPLLAVDLVMHFGGFAILNLYLQGGGRTLGEVLALTLRRFGSFVIIALAARLAFSIGLSLFILPGLLIFARTWLAGAAYAAQPEDGMLAAFRSGWRRSGRFNWAVMLFSASATLFAGLGAMMIAAPLLGLIAGMFGSSEAVLLVGNVALAFIAMLVWTAMTLLSIAFYRLTTASSGT